MAECFQSDVLCGNLNMDVAAELVMHQLIASLKSKYQYQLCCSYYGLPIDSITYLHVYTLLLH